MAVPQPGTMAQGLGHSTEAVYLGDLPPVKGVSSEWIGREAQVQELYDWLDNTPAGHMLVTGPEAAGKTSVIRCVTYLN